MVMKRTAALVGAAVLVLGVATGCALRGKPPERQVALVGIQVVSGLDAVGQTAKNLHTAKVLTDDTYRQVLLRLKAAYEQASRLGEALRAYDLAAGPDTASQVRAALDALAVLVPGVAGEVTGPAGAKLVALVGEVNRLLLTIAQALAPQASRLTIGGLAWAA